MVAWHLHTAIQCAPSNAGAPFAGRYKSLIVGDDVGRGQGAKTFISFLAIDWASVRDGLCKRPQRLAHEDTGCGSGSEGHEGIRDLDGKAAARV